VSLFEPTPTGDEAVDVVFRRLQQAMRGQATATETAIAEGDAASQAAAVAAQQQAQGIFFQSFEDPVEADWNVRQGPGTVTYPSNGIVGGKAFRTDAYCWLAYPGNIPFDPARLYRFRARIRMVQAPTDPLEDNAYFGFEGVAADGVTLVNTVGADSYSSQHYAGSWDMGAFTLGEWQEFTAYYKGTAATGTSGGATPQAAGVAHTNVRYLRPLFILNYPNGNGVMEIDYLAIEVITEDPEINALNVQDGAALVAANQAASIFGQPFSSATIASLMSGSAITEVQIEDNAITSPKIAANQILAGHILAGEISGSHVAANTITASNIQASTITTAEIAAGTILAGDIGANQITSALIAADQILSSHIGAGQVDALAIGAGAITTDKLDALAVTAAKIAAGAIEAGKISAGAINASSLFVAGVVDNTALGPNSVGSGEIASGAINSGTMIANGVIVTNHMTAGTINGDRISANTVDTGQIAAGAIQAGEISAGAVIAGKIGAGAVDTAELAAGAVTAAKIEAGTITAAQIAAGTITANEILTNTITANRLNITGLSTIDDDAGTITAGKLQNAGGTNYVDLDATLNAHFLHAGGATPQFYVEADGDAYFAGEVASDNFTAASAKFEASSGNYVLINSESSAAAIEFFVNSIKRARITSTAISGGQISLNGTSNIFLLLRDTGHISYKNFKVYQAGGNNFFSIDSSTNPVKKWHIRVVAGGTGRLAFLEGTHYSEEFYHDPGLEGGSWAFDGTLSVNKAISSGGMLFIGNRTGDPSTPTSGVYLYSKSGELYAKDGSGTVKHLTV
jgi:hypothetical protein